MKTIGNDIFTVVEDPDRVELFKKLVNEENVNYIDECTKHNLLQLAIANDNVIGAEHLIAKGIDINYQNRDKWTALYFCAFYYKLYPNAIEIANTLLKKGAKVNLYDKWGNTPMWYAFTSYSYNSNTDFIKLLLKYGAEYLINKNGITLMSIASQRGYDEILELCKQQSEKE